MALTVTSPLTEGVEVKEAQRLLKTNVFDENFLEDEVDGVFDSATGRACKRAKDSLGYPKANITPVFGRLLGGFLSGDQPLPDEFKERRRERLRAEKRAIRERALRTAKGELDTRERPEGSNNVKYSRWYMGTDGDEWSAGRPGPAWCLIFVSWCYEQVAGDHPDFANVFKQGSRHAFCPTVVALAAMGDRGFDQVGNPESGDLVFYQFDDDANADHVGIFEKWVDKGSTFTAIEGNTSTSSDANGGMVMRRTRSVGQVFRPSTGGKSFVRVGTSIQED